MNKTILKISLLITLLIPSVSMAIGIGPYGSFGIGKSKFEYENEDANYKKHWKLFSMCYSFGLMIDTAVAKDKLFNYRMKMGYGLGTVEVKRQRTDTTTGLTTTVKEKNQVYDLSMYNDFGFGIVRSRYIRFWLGPQFGINYSDEVNSDDFESFSFKLGPVFGLNINAPKVFTFTIDFGIRFHMSFASEPGVHFGYEGFVTAGALFRIEDEF